MGTGTPNVTRIARALRLGQNCGRDARWSFAYNLPLALRAESARKAWHQKLQVIVDLRHRSDRGSSRTNPVRLLDRNSGRNTENFVHQRFVHPLEKLAGVRAEGFDISALPFRIDRIEGQAGFAATAGTRDHMEPVEFQIEVDSFQVVLTRATNNDRILRRLSRPGHKTAKVIRDGPMR